MRASSIQIERGNIMAKYGKDVVEKVSTGLAKLPNVVEEYTTAQLVERLQPQIKDAMSRGYSIKQVVELLNENGVKVTVSTFKTYLTGKKKGELK